MKEAGFGVFHAIGNDPYVDWVVVFCVSLAVFLALLGSDASIYLGLDARLAEPASVGTNSATLGIDAKLLASFTAEYDARAVLRSQIPTAKVTPGDPSI